MLLTLTNRSMGVMLEVHSRTGLSLTMPLRSTVQCTTKSNCYIMKTPQSKPECHSPQTFLIVSHKHETIHQSHHKCKPKVEIQNMNSNELERMRSLVGGCFFILRSNSQETTIKKLLKNIGIAF